MQNFLLDIIVPNNYIQMIIWYTLLVVCTVLYIVFRIKKKGKKRSTLLQEKIDVIEDFKEQMMRDNAPSKKDLYSALFTLNSISDYCKETFESSQFMVYDETSKQLDKAMDLVKKIDVKKWKEDECNKEKTLIVECLDSAIVYLSQAL